MSIIFMILKIVGIILLVVLGIIIALILVLLFVPVRYDVKGKLDGRDIYVNGTAHWLLHFVHASALYDNSGFDLALRIIGIRVNRKRKEVQSDSDSDGSTTVINEEATDNDTTDIGADTPDSRVHREDNKANTVDTGASHEDTAYNDDSSDKGNITARIDNLKEKKDNIKGKFDKISDIKASLTDERNKSAIDLILKELTYLLRHYKFRKLKVHISFSTGDPAVTGQILGVLSLIPILYYYEINIYPDFESEKPYANGNFTVAGKIRLVHLLGSFMRLITKREVRRLIKTVRGK